MRYTRPDAQWLMEMYKIDGSCILFQSKQLMKFNTCSINQNETVPIATQFHDIVSVATAIKGSWALCKQTKSRGNTVTKAVTEALHKP